MTELAPLVARLLAEERLVGATLSRPRRRGGVRRITIRPVALKAGPRWSWTHAYASRETTENLTGDETGRRLVELVGGEFRQALLQGRDADYQVLASRPDDVRVLERPAAREGAPAEHDRRKRYLLAEGEPVPFLVELGVMTPAGKVRAQRYDKFRQVNRFLELVDDVVPSLPPEGPLTVVDFGCGKSYLTFALHHLLTHVHGREVDLVGLDLKEDVIERCSGLAATLGCAGLRFERGSIERFGGLAHADLVVSLHACDTATDEALAQAVRWGTEVILAVPCCQHELLRQIESRPLAPLLRHGTLRERFAAEVTDAARAQLLGIAGYDVQLVEFVELEHTPKNVLIRAVRRPGRERERLRREYAEFKQALGIEPALERLLGERVAA